MNEENRTHQALNDAFTLFDQGKLDDALAAYIELQRQERDMTPAQRRSLLAGLVYVHSAMRHHDLAITYGEKLLAMSVDFEERHVALHQLAMAYRMKGDDANALHALEEERALIQQHGGDPFRLAVNGYELGVVATGQGRYTDAGEILYSALCKAQTAGDAMTIACLYRALGELRQAMGNIEEAGQMLQLAAGFFEKAGDPIAVQEVQVLLDAMV